MAEEVIGLKIQLNGINTVIRDAETFEKVLKEANQDLIDIGINFGVGTKEYQQLAKEIDTAEKTFNKIKTGAKGGRAELEEYKRGAEDFTRAFAGATAALTLFGGESESVSEAQKIASQGVAVAVAAQTIAQTELAGATIATTITLRAQTLAANTSSTALRALFTTIAANPVGALITVLGLALTAFQLFSKGADEAAASQREFNDSVNKEAGQTIGKLQVLTTTIQNSALSIEERKNAITELRKIAGPYYKDLSDEQILTRNLTTDIDNLKTSVLALAEARALQGRIEDRATQILTAEDELVVLKQKVDAAKELNKVQGIVGGGSVAGVGGGAVNEARNVQRLANAEDDYNNKLTEKNTLIQLQQRDLTRLNTTTTTYTKNLGDGTKVLDKNTEADKKAADAAKLLADAYRAKTDAQLKDLQLLITVGEIEGSVDADILKRAQKTLDDAQQLIDDRNKFFKTARQEFSEELGRLLFDVIPTEAELGQLQDVFNTVFSTARQGIQSLTTKLLDENGKAITFTLDNLSDVYIDVLRKFQNETSDVLEKQFIENTITQFKQDLFKLTPEQINILEQYFNFLSENAQRFSTETFVAGFKIQPSTKEDIEKNLTDFVTGYVNIIENTALTQVGKQTELQKLVQSIFTLPQRTQQEFITEADKTGEVGFTAYNEAIKSITKELLQFAVQSDKVSNEVDKTATKLFEILLKLKDAQTVVGDLSIGTGIVSPEDVTKFRLNTEQIGEITDLLIEKIKGAPETLTFLLDDIGKQYDKYLLRFGKEGLQNLLVRLTSEYDELDNLTRKQLDDLLVYVDGWIVQAQTTLGDDAAQPFIQLKERIGKALNDLPVEVDKEFEDTLKAVENGIRNLQQILGQVGTLLSDSFTFELEKLENDYSTALDSVVGDTKEANDKRIELEKAYQKQKKELEKQARLTSLRITLAETIAGGAQGVVSALSVPPPAGPILAGINGAIAAAQIALVSQQLEYVSSLRRGGRLAAGGMVIGPSHENGGVRFMNGGVELEGNEAVINRNSTIQYTNLLSTINQSQGGRPILVGNAMDSRLIEVLAKQKQEPIRAYVLESDITKSQTINRKLEQLASF